MHQKGYSANYTSFHGHASNSSNNDVCICQAFDMKFRNLQNAGLITSKMMLQRHLCIKASLIILWVRRQLAPPPHMWLYMVSPEVQMLSKNAVVFWLTSRKDTYRVSVVQNVHSLYPVWSPGTRSCLHQAQLRPKSRRNNNIHGNCII